MPVQEFECQIARGQIGRYLNGEGLSSEGLRHLGVHVAECSGCKKFLDQRKATLQGMLGETPMPEQESMQAVVGVNPSEALIAQIRARSAEVEPEPETVRVVPKAKPIITKPLMYCGALALVLVGMTYVSRNMTGFLGQNAAQAIASNAPTKQAASPVTTNPTPEATKVTPETKPAADANTAKVPEAASAKPDPTPANASTPGTDQTKPATSDAVVSTHSDDTNGATKTAVIPEKDADATKPGIEPTAKGTTSPISINPTPTKATPSKKTLVPTAKPKAKVGRWHQKWRSHRKGGIFNLKPGTAAIHVYSKPQ